MTENRSNSDTTKSSSPQGLDDDILQPSLHQGLDDVVQQRSSQRSSNDVLHLPRPSQIRGVSSESAVININEAQAPQFGDTIIHTTGPVYNAPVALHQHNYYTLIQQRQTVHLPNEQHQTSTQLPAPVALEEETSPKSFDETPSTSHQPHTSRSQSASSLDKEPQNFRHSATQRSTATSRTTAAESLASQHQQTQANGNIKCAQLKSLLEREVKAIASEESTLAEFIDRALEPVPVAMVNKPQQIDEFHAEGHSHRKEELYKTPESDITSEEMFDRAIQTAQQEAEKKFKAHEREAKQNYIEKHGNVVGVVGQAGIGKTTSAKKWALQALDGQMCGRVSFIFYITIRLLNFKVKMTFLQFLVSTMLSDWNCSLDEATFLLATICSDPYVLIIFDGLDEAAFKSFSSLISKPHIHAKNTAESYLKHLAGGNLLPRARKIFTSRPAQLYKLHPSYRPKFIVQILGLTPKSQNELGRQICGNKYNVIHHKFLHNPNVFAYCYVPVNFILTLNYLVNYEGDIQFVSLTRVLAFTCSQYVTTDHVQGQECELEKLAKMAWDTFLEDKLVFKDKDFKKAGIKTFTADAFLTTSVLKQVNLKLTILDGHKVRYFSHLTWQEFFAAFYLMMKMPLEEFQKQQKLLTEDRWEVVSKFAFGICDSWVFNRLGHLVSGSFSEDWSLKKFLLTEFLTGMSTAHMKRVCSWAHESNDPEVASSVTSRLPNVLNFSGLSFFPDDIENLFFVLQHRANPLKALDLSRNNIGNLGASSLARCLHKLEVLVLESCEIGSDGVKQLCDSALQLEKPMELLDLSYNNLTDESAESLARCVHNISVLYVWENCFTEAGKKLISSKSRGKVVF